jgi:hypothetical protein
MVFVQPSVHPPIVLPTAVLDPVLPIMLARLAEDPNAEELDSESVSSSVRHFAEQGPVETGLTR